MTNPRRLGVAGLVLVALCAPSSSPVPAFAQNLAPAPAAPRQPRAQAIDPLTASIEGRVTTADSGAAIRRAEVRAMSASGINRLATTDGEGRFHLRDLPAGEYRVSVSKTGFVPLTYGQRRPFEAPQPIHLRRGQRATANGAITGRVFDEAGEPITDVPVGALRSRTAEGRRRLEPVGPTDRSDDTGAFRLYGLPPGDYFVTAMSPQRADMVWMGGAPVRTSPAAAGRSTLLVFFPGTTNPAEAQPVTVGAGGEVRADVQMTDLRGSTVAGSVFSSSGAPAVDAMVTLRSTAISVMALVAATAPPLVITGHTNSDGTFSIADVPPGTWNLTVTLRPFPNGVTLVRTTSGQAAAVDPATGRLLPAPDVLAPETATMPVVVTTGDLTGLSVTTRTPGSIAGSFVADAGVTRPLPQGLGVTLASAEGSQSMMHFGGQSFRLAGLTGLANLSVRELPETWMVKSIVVDGTDQTDQPLDFRNGGAFDVRIVLTDRLTAVTGRVTGAAPQPDDARPDGTVVIFPEDATKWTYPSRYVRAARTDEQGTFRVTGLPPERYLAVAVDFVEDGEWTDPEFLERIRPDAAGFSLADAETRTLDVRLLRR